MKLTRRAGAVRLHFDAVETSVLAALFDDLTDALVSLDADDPVTQRLYPDGYQDDFEAAAEFRSLTESALRDARRERVEQCRGELSADQTLNLDKDAVQRWLMVINDLRLAIGTRLDVREDTEPDFEPGDPEAQSWQVYYWLTALQDRLVGAAR